MEAGTEGVEGDGGCGGKEEGLGAGGRLLSRRDSYSDIGMRSTAPFPLASIPSRTNTPDLESPTNVPLAFGSSRNVSSKPIASIMDFQEVVDEAGPSMRYWKGRKLENIDLASRAAADVGMRRMPGLTRKISDSRRIMVAPIHEKDVYKYTGGDLDGAPENSNEASETLDLSDSDDRRDLSNISQDVITTYDLSSDEDSTSSSLRSIGTKSPSEKSSKPGLPHTISFSHSKNRASKCPRQLPPLDLQQLEMGPPASNSTSERQLPDLTQPEGSIGFQPSRLLTSSPLKSNKTSSSLKSKSATGLEIPSNDDDSMSNSRLSSLSGKVTFPVMPSGPPPLPPPPPPPPPQTSTTATITAAGQNSSAPPSRSVSANITAAVNRSDSNSSSASASTTLYNAKIQSNSAIGSTAHGKQGNGARNRQSVASTGFASAARCKERHLETIEPPIPDPASAPKVEQAPASGMYWYKAPTHGMVEHKPLRAHTCTLVGSNIYVFGGCDLGACFDDLHVFDADSMSWSRPQVHGNVPPPLRAMTCTAVRNKLVIFGGGDGPTYYNDVYIFDTTTSRYSKVRPGGTLPCRRRAHTACLYKNGIYVFGGGDGVRALNDVWRLDVADLNKPSWRIISSAYPAVSSNGTARSVGTAAQNDQCKPHARGYHTANMVGSKLIIYGGSDGDECFKDVWVFDVDTALWRCVEIKKSFSRLSHTATVIGSYLFVVGGHDGVEYSSEVLLLNLVTMQWDRRKVYGIPPSGRGYHCAVLYDSRLFIIGGFDGHQVFNDTFILELAVSSYYSQISHFSVVVNPASSSSSSGPNQ